MSSLIGAGRCVGMFLTCPVHVFKLIAMKPIRPRVHINEIQFQFVRLVTLFHTDADNGVFQLRRYNHFEDREGIGQGEFTVLPTKSHIRHTQSAKFIINRWNRMTYVP